MCQINNSPFKKASEKIEVYKVLTINSALFGTKYLSSLYSNFRWEFNKKRYAEQGEFSPNEIVDEIGAGAFHSFIDYSEAFNFYKTLCGSSATSITILLVKAIVPIDSLYSIGELSMYGEKSIASTELILKRVIKLRRGKEEDD